MLAKKIIFELSPYLSKPVYKVLKYKERIITTPIIIILENYLTKIYLKKLIK